MSISTAEGTKLERWCDGIIEAGWLAAIIVTPLFFNIHSSRVFEPDKLTLLRSIALVMLAAWLVKFIDQGGWLSPEWLWPRSENSIWRMPLVLPVFLIATVYLISTIFSITPSVSWAGSYQRLQGTYTTLSYLVIFALMIATIRNREQVSRVVTVAIVTSIPIALYGMLQHFGLDPLPWGGDVQQRVAGNMGNSIFIAAYLIMVVPLTLARIIDAFTNILQDEEIATADIIRSSIYIFSLAIQLITIYWSRSRGPFLGLAVSIYAFVLILLVTLRNAEVGDRRLGAMDVGRSLLLVGLGILVPLLLAIYLVESQVSAFASLTLFIGAVGLLAAVILILALARRGWRWLWLSWIFLAVTMAGVLGLFNIGEEASQNFASVPVVGDTLTTMNTWRDLPEIGRFGQLLQSEGGSGRVRVLIWEGVLELIAPHEPLEKPQGQTDPFNFLRPVVGYGPESMYVAYNRFYQPELATIEARNASPDRSHNETFDAVVITGALGLLAWQFLYLSVFYYGFRWLGVVKSSRDRNWLIGLWIGGGIVGGVVLSIVLELSFVGVAIPFGTIAGLVIYLIYYALSSKPQADDEEINPFGIDRLLMIGLIAAMLAHYVEIHFGIAIAATRTYFFVYAALMFMVGYYLPRIGLKEHEPEYVKRQGRRRRARAHSISKGTSGWLSPTLSYALILGLIIGILAYDYITYSLPGGQVIESIEQVPSAGEIFHQSFFINPALGFSDSPFLFILMVMTWALGGLVMISEMAKNDQIGLKGISKKLISGRNRTGIILLIGMGLICVAIAIGNNFITRTPSLDLMGRMGFWLLLIWAGICLWAAVKLYQDESAGRNSAGLVALIGLAFALPVLAAGGTLFAFALVVFCGAILYLLWDDNWSELLLPAGIVSILSMAIGLTYAYLHAYQIRAGILLPPGVTETTPTAVRRVLETDQAASVLTMFYIFVLLLLVTLGLALALDKINFTQNWATLAGAVTGLAFIPIVVILISTTNLRVIQADIVYKRADPWDKQAGRTGDPDLWDNAIAIYEHAIELAPFEDFYYLWLGRAYLERSSVTEDPAEREALLETAANRLEQAQNLNPFNTDHTANLARLNTRWSEITEGEVREVRVSDAVDYYESALSLSPKNSVIRNEYARLAYLLEQDCDKALTLYDKSVEIDPYFTITYFDRAEVYMACAEAQPETERASYYIQAADSMEAGLERSPGDARRWMQLAEMYVRLDETEKAIDAYHEALAIGDENLPGWQLDYTLAQWFFEEGDLDNAESFGENALASAPDDAATIIQQFLAGLNSGGVETGG